MPPAQRDAQLSSYGFSWKQPLVVVLSAVTVVIASTYLPKQLAVALVTAIPMALFYKHTVRPRVMTVITAVAFLSVCAWATFGSSRPPPWVFVALVILVGGQFAVLREITHTTRVLSVSASAIEHKSKLTYDGNKWVQSMTASGRMVTLTLMPIDGALATQLQVFDLFTMLFPVVFTANSTHVSKNVTDVLRTFPPEDVIPSSIRIRVKNTSDADVEPVEHNVPWTGMSVQSNTETQLQDTWEQLAQTNQDAVQNHQNEIRAKGQEMVALASKMDALASVVERQVGQLSLGEQALTNLKHDLQTSKTATIDAEDQLFNANAALESLGGAYTKVEKDNETLVAANHKLTERLDKQTTELQDERDKLQLAFDECKTATKSAEKRLQSAGQNLARSNMQLTKQTEQLRELQDTLAVTRDQAVKAETNQSEAVEKLERYTESMSMMQTAAANAANELTKQSRELHEFKHAAGQKVALEEQLRDAQDQLAERTDQLAEQSAARAKIQEQSLRADQELAELQAALAAAKEKAANEIQEQSLRADQELAALRAASTTVQNQLRSAQEQLTEQQSATEADAHAQSLRAGQELAELQAALAAAKEKAANELTKQSRELREFKNAAVQKVALEKQLLSAQEQLTKELSAAQAEVQAQSVRAGQELAELKAALSTAKAALAKAEADRSATINTLEQKTQQMSMMQTASEGAETRVRELEAAAAKLQRQLASASAPTFMERVWGTPSSPTTGTMTYQDQVEAQVRGLQALEDDSET